MLRRMWILITSRTKEFYRDRSALGWNILFPFMVIIGFSFIFNQDDQILYKVGVIDGTPRSEQIENSVTQKYESFKKTKFIDFITVDSEAKGKDILQHHRIDFLINPHTGKYWVSDTSPKGYIVERLLQSSNNEKTEFQRGSINGHEVPYIEWLFPGILGMNIMFSSLFGVGYVIVRYRKNGVLKRFSVTPVRTFEFITSQIISRMIVIASTTVLVYAGCSWLYGFSCRGSYFHLFLMFILGGFSLVSMGLLVASRSSSEEFAGGILNLISWPMMFLSEVWFSLEGANPVIIKISKLFPLTHMIEGSRMIMNDGASFGEIQGHLLILTIMSLVFITISSFLFNWNK